MSDFSRHFVYSRGEGDANRGDKFYQGHIASLSEKCWDHYEKNISSRKLQPQSKASLYTGYLGPGCYLRYRLATSPCFGEFNFGGRDELGGSDIISSVAKKSRFVKSTPPINVPQQEETTRVGNAKWKMLSGAMSSADYVLKQCQRNERSQRVSLLEGEFVGALVMKIVVANALLNMINDGSAPSCHDTSELEKDITHCKNQLLRFGSMHVASNFHASECEVLYGRCGYLKAIKFVQTETQDRSFGREVAREILAQIWEEGIRSAAEEREKILSHGKDQSFLPLVWKWHDKLYTGAAHGIVGILHTLLDFIEDLIAIDPRALEIIELTTVKLDEFCFASGNLQSSIVSGSDAKRSDRLVQFCHGGPGHVLLLMHLYHTKQLVDQESKKESRITCSLPPQHYLTRAREIARSVILPRGLLRKGVGLCHGIGGNAYCFIAIHRVTSLGQTLNLDSGREVKSDGIPKAQQNDELWLDDAYHYANFALDHLKELEDVPDRPYSLYEGMAGLICFLLGLVEIGDDLGGGANSKFPCYEFN